MDDLHEANADTPVTAEWLRSNTRIRGWLALFMLGLLLSPLWSLDETVVMVDPAECYGSIILATTGIVTVLGLLVVAIWTLPRSTGDGRRPFSGRGFSWSIACSVAFCHCR